MGMYDAVSIGLSLGRGYPYSPVNDAPYAAAEMAQWLRHKLLLQRSWVSSR